MLWRMPASTVAPMPRMALFLAGKASVQYRNAGGVRSGVLPDFFIGAHASGRTVAASDAGYAALPNLFSDG